ncbi:hypothetical protein JB92DRAFT_3098907, partial [Gautieria morchelliformis]
MHVPSSLSPSNIRKRFITFTRTLSPLLPFLQVKRDRPYPASTTTTAPSDSARAPNHFAVLSRPGMFLNHMLPQTTAHQPQTTSPFFRAQDNAPAPKGFAVLSRPAPKSAPLCSMFKLYPQSNSPPIQDVLALHAHAQLIEVAIDMRQFSHYAELLRTNQKCEAPECIPKPESPMPSAQDANLVRRPATRRTRSDKTRQTLRR